MRHLGTKDLKTKHLSLRKFRSTDAADMFYHYCSNPEVTRFMTWPVHRNLQTTQHLLDTWLNQYDENTYMWAIVLNDINEVIGTISVTKLDLKTETAELGYAISQHFWNHGYMSEALKAVLQFLFEEVEMNRIEACHDSRNPASGAVMKKCGMVYEGKMRQANRCNVGLGDLEVYRILKSEWKKEDNV